MVKVGEVPAYRSVFIADMICIAIQGESTQCRLMVTPFLGILLAILRIYYVRQNRARDLRQAAEGPTLVDEEFTDKTDKELPGFRYVVSACDRAPGNRRPN